MDDFVFGDKRAMSNLPIALERPIVNIKLWNVISRNIQKQNSSRMMPLKFDLQTKTPQIINLQTSPILFANQYYESMKSNCKVRCWINVGQL